MSVVADQGLPLGRQARHDHGGAAPQIGGGEGRAVQAVHAPDLRDFAVGHDVRAQTAQLRHLAVAVFKDIFRNAGQSLCFEQGGHQHRLGVGGKTGIRGGGNLPHGLQLPLRTEPDTAVGAYYITARLI